ncbi:MAG: cysteine ABC transporter substrate-binding protein [Deltaproteobacteria bacterium]|jgi:polar amino acid transport system substrate-binding protein|nr:cysteine ABC transporter substrate-binding protein [Deltaproteobacteria bacterium]
MKSAIIFKRALAAVAVLAGAVLLLAAPAPAQAASFDSLDAIKARGSVRIGVFSDKPPFGFVDSQGRNQGYDVFFARRIARDLFGDENKVEFVLVEAASRVEFLQSNKVDIILANFTVTPDRAQKVDFAKPYMKVALGVVSPATAKITDVAQLKGKKLIVNKGTTAELYFTEKHPEISLLKYDQNTEAFNALKDRRGAALAHDNTLLFAWSRENPGFVAGIEFLGSLDAIAPAVAKGNASLLNWLNDEIVKLGKERFFHQAYDATLKPVYGDDIDPESVVTEGGDID